MEIHFNKIKVDTIESNSGIFIGRNFANFNHYSKSITGISGGTGGNKFKNNISIIFDNDFIDFAVPEPKPSYVVSCHDGKTMINSRKNRKNR